MTAAKTPLLPDPNRIRFLRSATRLTDFPPPEKPDVAVAGRSNVGKSSLINCLFGRKKLAKVSQTPGVTRTINFYDVEERFYLVDLPGYGYAKRSIEERESWREMVEAYLTERKTLAVMLVLMDARRGDEEEEWLLLRALRELEVPALAVMTKSDKLSKSERLARHHALRKKLAGYVAATVMFSSHTGEGREELWRNVLRLLS